MELTPQDIIRAVHRRNADCGVQLQQFFGHYGKFLKHVNNARELLEKLKAQSASPDTSRLTITEKDNVNVELSRASVELIHMENNLKNAIAIAKAYNLPFESVFRSVLDNLKALNKNLVNIIRGKKGSLQKRLEEVEAEEITVSKAIADLTSAA